MLIIQEYSDPYEDICDLCGEKTLSTAGFVKIERHDIFAKVYYLCNDHAKEIYEKLGNILNKREKP